MEKIVKLILDNKEWIFSGIGVTIIFGAIRFVLSEKSKYKTNIKSGNSSTNIQAGNGAKITISPSDKHHHNKQFINYKKNSSISSENFLIQIDDGDFQEFFCDYRIVRIEVSNIKKRKFQVKFDAEKELYSVEINVSDGGLFYGGSCCKEIGVNKYIVPVKKINSHEENFSIYKYQVNEDFFCFLRFFVDHINPHSRQVTLNVFFAGIDNTMKIKS